jgi:Asp-tRNA(Asn)/Glu-tRNA(Gln) amidotransferase A subunit family amidase
VNLRDIAGLLGGEPGPPGTPGQTPQQQERAAQLRREERANPRLLPDEPLNLPKLRAVDAHLAYRAERVQGRSVPFDDLALRLDVVDGTVALRPLSFGVGRGRIAADVLAAYDQSLETLARLGAEIVPLALPCGFADVAALNGRIMAAEGYAILADLVDDESLPLDEDVRPRLRAGRDITARAYIEALRRRDEMKEAFAAALAEVDALLTPTTETAALPLAAVDQSKAPSHFTRFVNFLDLCALALPNGFTAEGLPTSLQIVCRGYEEATALRIGWAYQSATDWHERRPPGT